MQPPRYRRRRRQFRALRRLVLAAVLAVVLVPALPWLAVVLFVDADTLRSGIEAAALRATGRVLSLGHVTMLSSVPPTIAAEDITFANAPGASRRDMLRIPYVEATLATLPLLFGRLEIASLVLSRPDLVLETDPAGVGNWRFAPPGAGEISRRPRWARRHAAQARASVILEQVQIREGRLGWRDPAGDWIAFDIKRLNAAAPGMAEPGELTAQVVHADRTVSVALNTGRLDRLSDAGSTLPWPVRLSLDVPGARAGIAGTLSRPRDLRGYDLTVDGTAEDLGALQSLLHARLPPLRKLVFRTRLVDRGGTVPEISGISLRARQSDLGAWVPGLQLAAVDLAADSFDRPVRAALDGVFDGSPLHLAADLGAPAALLTLGQAPGSWPVSLAVEAAGGSLSAKGAIAAPEHGTGLDLDVAGTMPDLAALSPLLGIRLPALRNVTVGLHAGDGEGGFRQGLALRNLTVRSAEADVAGELELRFTERTPVRAVLTGRRLDLDALRAAIGGSGTALPGPVAAGWLLPSERLPFDSLLRTDLDLHATIAELRLGGALFRDASVIAGLRDGELTVDPFIAALPGGGIELRAALNARPRFPPVILSLRAAGVPVRPVFGALGWPDDAVGTIGLVADLSSAGASWRELAAGLTGQAGMAINGAELDNRLLETVFGPALRAAGLSPPGIGMGAAGRRTPVRCLALRFDARDGVGGLHGFVLDTPSLLLEAEGTVQFRDERLALRLRPTPHGSALPVAPVRIGGVFAQTTIYPEQQTVEAPGLPAAGSAPDACADALAVARAAVPESRPR